MTVPNWAGSWATGRWTGTLRGEVEAYTRALASKRTISFSGFEGSLTATGVRITSKARHRSSLTIGSRTDRVRTRHRFWALLSRSFLASDTATLTSAAVTSISVSRMTAL